MNNLEDSDVVVHLNGNSALKDNATTECPAQVTHYNGKKEPDIEAEGTALDAQRTESAQPSPDSIEPTVRRSNRVIRSPASCW